MHQTFTYPEYPYRPSPELAQGRARRYPVVVIGAGPVGLTAALDCAVRGLPVVVLDDNNTVSIGSRAVCYAKRPLEIWDRLGCGQWLADKGVNWKIGKVFFRDELTYQFDLLPQPGHKMPAMINLQQYYLEHHLVEHCGARPEVDLRWKHKVVGLVQQGDHATLTIETPEGRFEMQADWVIACDGANSAVRKMVGADFSGQVFQDRFLIADVVMKAGFPPERWFWFDPPFHPGQSVLLHKQCDDVWRIDFQLGRDADPEWEKQPEQVIPRLRAMLGEKTEFELEWVSVYQFACRRIDQFRHGRVVFAGDSAHQVSPFGARGANTGVQDADNLIWKLKLVLDGAAPEALIDSYADERTFAADDNLLNSTRATDFITPKSPASLLYRNAVLELAQEHPFARVLINSGRLSTPTPYLHSRLNTPDEDEFRGAMHPGSPCADAPIRRGDSAQGWFLNSLGDGFVVLCFGPPPAGASIAHGAVGARLMSVGEHPGADLRDPEGLLEQRFDARHGTVYLIRPDQHVAARWRAFDTGKVQAALARCLAA